MSIEYKSDPGFVHESRYNTTMDKFTEHKYSLNSTDNEQQLQKKEDDVAHDEQEKKHTVSEPNVMLQMPEQQNYVKPVEYDNRKAIDRYVVLAEQCGEQLQNNMDKLHMVQLINQRYDQIYQQVVSQIQHIADRLVVIQTYIDGVIYEMKHTVLPSTKQQKYFTLIDHITKLNNSLIRYFRLYGNGLQNLNNIDLGDMLQDLRDKVDMIVTCIDMQV